MRTDKQEAMSLRLQGYSYSEIKRKLGVPKSTLSDWFSELVLSENAQERISKRTRKGSLRGLLKSNKLQTHRARQQAKEAREQSRKAIKSLSRYELLLLGAALYWGEGYKRLMKRNGRELTSHYIGLSNADPKLIQAFIRFLREVIGIPNNRIHGSIRIYQHINADDALRYWIKVTGIPATNFEKFYYGVSKSTMHKRPYERLPYGTIQVRVGDTKNFHRIIGLIEGIKQKI